MMMPTDVEGALSFAALAHRGQEYRRPIGNEPYIFHPVRVAMSVPPEAQVVAICHDLLEDTGTLPSDLSQTDRDAVILLTRQKDEELYGTYIMRVAHAHGEAGHIARTVKAADLLENLSGFLGSKLVQRYQLALRVIEQADPEAVKTVREIRQGNLRRAKV